MKLTPNTYIISDTHFGHKNIIKYQKRPQNSDELINDRWNNTVKKKDTILHLGDLTLGTFAEAKKHTENLQGRKFIILGNHDIHSESWYNRLKFAVIPSILYTYIDENYRSFPILLTHEPVLALPLGWYNIHGHTHNTNPVTQKTLTRRHFNTCVEVLDYTPIKLKEILDRIL